MKNEPVGNWIGKRVCDFTDSFPEGLYQSVTCQSPPALTKGILPDLLACAPVTLASHSSWHSLNL